MNVVDQPRPISLAKSALLIFLLALLFLFNRGPDLVYEALAFALLITYHLLTDRRFSSEQIRTAGLMVVHIGLYLLLCTLVIWVTTEDEESPFWIIYLLPIAVAAANLGMAGTLATCGAAAGLFVGMVPSRLYLDAQLRGEEIPELLVFSITFFIVGVLIQSFSEQHRRQLALQKELNERLLGNQQVLKESLGKLEAAEESLRRKDRLAALGEMSAGIAHEIRNPLGVISSSVQLLDRKMAAPAAGVRQLLDIIEEETTRLNALITDFLTFGRPSAPLRQRFDAGGLVLREVAHVGGLAEEKEISITTLLPEAEAFVTADPDMIRQVLLNLLLNALEATEAGGEIRVRLEMKDGSCLLEVADSGCGIPEENLSKVFNPFFTTKEKGTGLGLANVHKIVEAHKGEISVRSSPGEGTAFSVRLPEGKES